MSDQVIASPCMALLAIIPTSLSHSLVRVWYAVSGLHVCTLCFRLRPSPWAQQTNREKQATHIVRSMIGVTVVNNVYQHQSMNISSYPRNRSMTMHRNPIGTVDPVTETAVNAKVAALVALRGAELETLLQARDPDRSGEVRVKGFSECLRAWDSGESVRRRSSEGGAGGDSSQGEGKPGGEKHGDVGALTHADRKVLYKRWAVKGYVNYDEFLRASGHHAAPPARFSGASTAALAAATAARLHSFGKRGKRPSRGARGAASEANREDDQEEKALLARARVVLVHLSEVSLRGGYTKWRWAWPATISSLVLPESADLATVPAAKW